MKRPFATLTTLGILVTLAVIVNAQGNKGSRGVAGTWALTVAAGAHGDTPMTLVLKQDGEKVSGSLATPHGEALFTGRFSGTALELETSAADEHSPRVLLKGTLKDDGTLAGYMSGERGDTTWSAVRQKDKK